MKNRSRVLAQVFLLLFLFSGCSDDAPQSSSAVEAVPGAEQASKILEIIREPALFVRTEKLISVLRAVPADQTPVFEEVLSGIKIPNRGLDRLLVVTAWAKYDAPAATKWAKNREHDEVVRSAMFAESIYLWALEDLDSFLSDMEMALFMLPGIEESMMRALLRGWFDSGEPNLKRYVRDMTPQSIDRQRAIDTLVRLMIERDGPGATIEWAESLGGDVRYRAAVYSRVAGQVVVIDSKLAVDWCAEVCDSPLGEGMPHMMAVSWASKSGEEAMDFISSLPDAIGVQTGSRAAYRRFLIDEPERASAWMEMTTEEERRGPVLQGPVGMYMNKLSGQQPLRAIEWLGYIQDEEERKSRLIPVMKRWLRKDERAAEEWMAQSSMSDEAKLMAHERRVPPKNKPKLQLR